MFRVSLRIFVAIDTRAVTPIVPLVAVSDLKRSIEKLAQSKSTELPSSHAILLLHAREMRAPIERAAAAK
jgi:hypothetical protein